MGKNTKKAVFIGEICWNLIKSGCLKGFFEVAHKTYFPSPLSLGSLGNVEISDLEIPDRFGIRLDITKDISCCFDKSTDYLIIDLARIISPLFKVKEELFTAPMKEKTGSCSLYNDWKESAFDPVKEDPEKFYFEFDQFVASLLHYISGDKIILIHAHIPVYFVTGKYVRKAKENKQTQNFIDAFENRMKEKTNCFFIDITKYYFSKKQGTHLNPFFYEDDAYRDGARIIKNINLVNSSCPDKMLSYSRCIRYDETLNKSYLDIFLDKENLVDEFVRIISAKLLEKYLLPLAKLSMSGGNEAYITKNIPTELKEIYIAYRYVVNGNITELDVNYDKIFECGLKIPSLLDYIRATLAEDIPSTKQITYYNYEYYFYKAQRKSSQDDLIIENAENKIQLLKEKGDICLEPFLFDIWGSCISRIPVNFNERCLAVNEYLFRVAPFGIYNSPQEKESSFLTGESWANSLLEMQLNHTAINVLNNSGSEWVIIDLYAVSALLLYKYGKDIYHIDSKKIVNQLGAEKIEFYNDDQSKRYLRRELIIWINYLKQRYGENIILVKNRRSEYYLDLNGKIRPFPSRRSNADKNALTGELNEMIAKYLNCYYIDFVDQFLSDEMSFLELRPVHFENELYIEEGKLIEKIMRYKPDKRHYDSYSNKVRVRRIYKLLKSNPGHPLLDSLFNDKVLDSFILKLNPSVILDNEKQIIELYDLEFKDETELMVYLNRSDCYSFLKNICYNH